MLERIQCTFFRDSHDRIGVRSDVSWRSLITRLVRHDEGDKDGPAICAGLFTGPRGNASLTHRTFIALDIETHRTTEEIPKAPEAMADFLRLRRIESVVWTTHSHTVDAPRYRVLLPLAEPMLFQQDIDPFLSAAAAAELRVSGTADASKFGAASLFYLARHRPDAPWFSEHITGELMDLGRLETAAMISMQRIARNEAEQAAMRRARALPPEVMAKIEAYNATHTIQAQLERYGYIRDGMRWKSPLQTRSSQAATSILPDNLHWTSFSESDAQAGVGQRPQRASSQCACWGDAFALRTFFEYRGNFRVSLEEL